MPRIEYEYITRMIETHARVLDIGCGDGTLLSLLKRERAVRGVGIDIDIDNIIKVIDRGHDVVQHDIDVGLSLLPDNSYDYAILSETLQVTRNPRIVLREMLRVARSGIVAFPNFGKLSHRLYLMFAGKMPKGGALPYEWYNTPNIHLFTLLDFLELCKNDAIVVTDIICIPSGPLGRLMMKAGMCNAAAEKILACVSLRERVGADQQCAVNSKNCKCG